LVLLVFEVIDRFDNPIAPLVEALDWFAAAVDGVGGII